MCRRTFLLLFLCASTFAGLAAPARADVVYDTTTASAAVGISSTDLTGLYGDQVTLTKPGTLDTFSFAFFNSSSGNTGSILTGNATIRFYDSTLYSGSGALPPLLGGFVVGINFGSGLTAGTFTNISVTGLTGLNLFLPQNLLITQQFTQTSGTSTRYGTVINDAAPSVGSSGNSIFISNSANAAGYYTVGLTNANLRYQVGVTAVPEPSTWGLASLMTASGLACAWARRRRAG